jgi:hypothetical protein
MNNNLKQILHQIIDLLSAGPNNIFIPDENEEEILKILKGIYDMGRLDQGKIDFATERITLRVVDDKGRVALVPPPFHFMDDRGAIRDIKEIFPRGT